MKRGECKVALFTDGMMLYVMNPVSSLLSLQDVLQNSETVSGLAINFLKMNNLSHIEKKIKRLFKYHLPKNIQLTLE